jgi:hypothetical protein
MLGLEPTVVGAAKPFECSYLDHVFTLRALLGAVACPQNGVQDRQINRNFGNSLFLKLHAKASRP